MTEKRQITLYGVMSPNVVKVSIMLEELHLPYELRYVSLFKGEQFLPAFRALNPLGKVPVLVDSALHGPLSESGAILFWLAEHGGQFLPERVADRYEVMQWLMIQMSSVGPMLGQFTHFSLLPAGTEAYSRGRYGALAESLYRTINDRLERREWIAGDAYSIADIATFPWAEYLERHGFEVKDYPHLQRWRAVIASRPAVIKGKARLGEEFSAASIQAIKEASSGDLDRFFGRTDKVPVQDYSAVKQLR